MNERFIQNAIFLYPQILESFLGKQGIKTDALLPLKYEEVLDIGRADLVFRERIPGSYALRLTSVGKRVLSLLEGAFANYRLSRLMLLETSKFLMPS
jgi:hypothetical protein